MRESAPFLEAAKALECFSLAFIMREITPFPRLNGLALVMREITLFLEVKTASHAREITPFFEAKHLSVLVSPVPQNSKRQHEVRPWAYK